MKWPVTTATILMKLESELGCWCIRDTSPMVNMLLASTGEEDSSLD
ncbi:MAG: hypothetical protein ABR881_21010 [Candidatus Sulfotelmatobacter sp.]